MRVLSFLGLFYGICLAYPARPDNSHFISLSSWIPIWWDRLPISSFWYYSTRNWTANKNNKYK